MQRNVLGDELTPCSLEPLTGFYRTGCCENHGDDPGMHVVCCRVSEASSSSSRRRTATTSSTPAPEFGFAGLVPGDQWCVCAARSGGSTGRRSPQRVVLESTHVWALEFVSLDDLRAHAV